LAWSHFFLEISFFVSRRIIFPITSHFHHITTQSF
jgi:hypothetical protein